MGNKRIYSPSGFLASAQAIFSHMDELRSANREGRVSKAFAEKIMLAVTQVNGCRYCSYAHSRLALSAGVPDEELHGLLAGDLGEFPPEEAVALIFAQHYAEQDGSPDPQIWQSLVDYYGEPMAQDVLAYIRIITFGNLLGNTLDAFCSRFNGKPAPDSSLLGEICVLLGAITVFPAGMLARTVTRLIPAFLQQ